MALAWGDAGVARAAKNTAEAMRAVMRGLPLVIRPSVRILVAKKENS